MPVNEYSITNVIVGSITHGADLLDSLTEICEKHGVTTGSISLIGAVSEAALAYYDQSSKTYQTIAVPDQPMEIASAIGNVSMRNGKPFTHLHAVLSGPNGGCIAGHVMKGTKVFACEFRIEKLHGPLLHREMDEKTGLNLWK